MPEKEPKSPPKCPKCGTGVLISQPRAVYCGKCGWDITPLFEKELEAQKTRAERAEAEQISAIRESNYFMDKSDLLQKRIEAATEIVLAKTPDFNVVRCEVLVALHPDGGGEKLRKAFEKALGGE